MGGILSELIGQLVDYHTNLYKDKSLIDFLKDKKGLTEDEINGYYIGYDEDRNEFTIGAKEQNGKFSEIKRFTQDDEGDWLGLLRNGYKEIEISESIDTKHYDSQVTFKGNVIGKELSSYLIPIKITVRCEGKQCSNCPNDVGEYSRRFTVHADKALLVQLINTSDQQVQGFLRQYLRLPPYNSCRKVKIEIEERAKVDEVRITSDINYERIDSDYVVNKGYVFGSQPIGTNQQYQYWGTTWHDPKNQTGVHLITDFQGARDSISKWKMTDEVRGRLELFRAKNIGDHDSIGEKLKEINTDLSENVTKMYKREDVINAMNMVYHSPISFNFLGDRLTKGWMECAIVGDTRTGKTETIKSLLLHYGAGEFLTSGENTTLAGILGGVQQTHQGRWSLTWGKIPLNDRRALIIDEADNLTEKGIIGNLSGVRSSGVAELVKVQTQKTMARTRLIFIANPLNGAIKDHNYGLDTVKEIFGKRQDIARLDFAIICAKNDVSDQDINKIRISSVEQIYDKKACHDRVMFAWNLMANNIVWEEGAEEFILEETLKLGDKYSEDIPLVVGSEFRIKLARMAVSVAVQTFSWTDEKVVVGKGHIRWASNWIQAQYDSDNSGYLEYTQQIKERSQLRKEFSLDNIIKQKEEVDILLSTSRIIQTDIEEIFNVDREGARNTLSKMRKCYALTKNSRYYKKTAPFIDYLKKRKKEFRAGGVLP